MKRKLNEQSVSATHLGLVVPQLGNLSGQTDPLRHRRDIRMLHGEFGEIFSHVKRGHDPAVVFGVFGAKEYDGKTFLIW